MNVISNELEKKPVLPYGEWETTEVEWATNPKTIRGRLNSTTQLSLGTRRAPFAAVSRL